MNHPIIHVVRIEADRITTDMDGDTENWDAFIDRHPDLKSDPSCLGRLRDLLTNTGHQMTTVRLTEAEWGSLSEYAAALAVDDDASEVSAALSSGPLATHDRKLVEKTLRANRSCEQPLFVVSGFPAILATHVRITVPESLRSAAPRIEDEMGGHLWEAPFVHHVNASEPHVHHALFPGQVQNVASRIARRLAAIAVLAGVEVFAGRRSWSASADMVATDELIGRFLATYDGRITDDSNRIRMEEDDPVTIELVAADFVAAARANGWNATPTQAEADGVVAINAKDGDTAARVARIIVASIINDDIPLAPRGLAY